MPSALLATTLMLALGQMPGGPGTPAGAGVYPVPDYGAAVNGGYQNSGSQNGGYQNGGYQSGDPQANAYFANAYGNYRINPAMQPVSPGGGPVTDPYLNYDAYEPWVHGYWQELPAFGGYAYFRPYNYRHVYVQSEVATSWQTSAQMPYAQEYYRRAREQGIYEQRTTATGRTGLPFVYRQTPRSVRQPEIIAKASAERSGQQKPAAKQAAATRRPSFLGR
jgi:hypothetical protein